LSETLTNLAQAYTVLGQKTQASLAIEEAKQSAPGGDQLHRINIAGARLGVFSKEQAREFVLDAANAAESDGFYETAFVRHCIGAYLAYEYKDWVWGQEAVRRAKQIEKKLNPRTLDPARLRFYDAVFIEQVGQQIQEVLAALLEGARLWCERLPGPLGSEDYREVVTLMHEHFRKLSAVLLTEKRWSEAFLAFEIGRSRGFAVEVFGGYEHPFLTANPFQREEIDCSLVERIQVGLAPAEAVVSLAILPPNLVAFVVSRERVDVYSVPIGKDLEAIKSFALEVHAIPAALENGRRFDCIPKQLTTLSAKISKQVAHRTIVLLAPNAVLHKVPWRVLLRESGLEWRQVPFVTQFSPFYEPDHPSPDVLLQSGAIGLGHGEAGAPGEELSFVDEAKDFADAFGTAGEFVRAASSGDLRAALCQEKIVLVSCHGTIVPTQDGDRFFLTLADGKHALDELIREKVASPLLILSACSSGTYDVASGDYPVGAAPTVLLSGANFCICTRFAIDAHFAKEFFPLVGQLLSNGKTVGKALADAFEQIEGKGYDLWRHLACVEILGRGITGGDNKSTTEKV
jgi:hypothetical protein